MLATDNPLVNELYYNILDCYYNNADIYNYIYVAELIDEDLTIEQHDNINNYINNIVLLLNAVSMLEDECGYYVYNARVNIADTDTILTTTFNNIDNHLTEARNELNIGIKLLIAKIIETVNNPNSLEQHDSDNNSNSTDSVSIEV